MVTTTIHDWRRLLLGVNVALAAALVASAAGLVLLPLETVDADRERPVAQRQDLPTARPAAGPLADYAVIYQRDLLRPLYDPKPVVKVTPKPQPPKLPVTLVGTVLEPGFSYGMFKTRDGRTKFVRVGQAVEGAELLAITDNEATVKFGGREIVLKVQKTQMKGSRR